MATVDPADDGLRRYIVRHYRYDPERRERRHVLVAAFDSAAEMEACLRSQEARLHARRAAGEAVDPKEYVSATTREPGADRLAANGHLLRRSARHGVRPEPWPDEVDLPRNLRLLSSGQGGPDEPQVRRWRRRLRGLLRRRPRRR